MTHRQKQRRRDPSTLFPYMLEYEAQRNMAIYRKIEWNITYDEWIEWWGDNIEKRGRKTNDLVMGRIDFQGPYSLENIVLRTHRENVIHGTQRAGNKRMRPVRTPLGDFRSVKEASQAHGHTNGMTIGNWCRIRWKGKFKYLDEDS